MTPALGREKPRVLEHLEMVGDGGLGDVEVAGDVADAGFPTGVTGDEAEQTQPHRIG